MVASVSDTGDDVILFAVGSGWANDKTGEARVRVISGDVGGFQLKGPPSRATRPMNDKLKGSLFSTFASLGIDPIRVLDLYAGTGSLGIEALSRGAEWADFVDQQAAACGVIRANLAHTRLTHRAHVHRMDVANFLASGSRDSAYDLVLMDPPYADPALVTTLQRVAASALVQSDGVIAIGHSPRVSLPDQFGQFERLRLRCHGDSCFSIYERPVNEDAGRQIGAGQHEEAGE